MIWIIGTGISRTVIDSCGPGQVLPIVKINKSQLIFISPRNWLKIIHIFQSYRYFFIPLRVNWLMFCGSLWRESHSKRDIAPVCFQKWKKTWKKGTISLASPNRFSIRKTETFATTVFPWRDCSNIMANSNDPFEFHRSD